MSAESRAASAESYQYRMASPRPPACTEGQFGDHWEAIDAYYVLKGIDLRRWPNDPLVREAVGEARAAVFRAIDAMSPLVWPPIVPSVSEEDQ